ncbi:MAG TPA: DNA alkylation repair protein [Nitrospira sp.]|nr:DNA alkylation repair protein [Nitrospira sp.]HNK49032.1 DNA alkylation repair protein [Nitrospira sp.]
MAEPLKNSFGADVPRTIARMIAAVSPRFDEKAFVRSVLDGYDELELMPRAWKIAHVLRRHLPDDYERALEMLLASLDQQSKRRAASGMGAFLFLPHVFFVAEYGLDHFEASMRAQYVLTQRFTAEFSIRRYLERHQAATLARLAEWTADPSEDVRRLVSEGTRPRLPWAPRLRAFQADPRPVLALLERLKDDPSLYVRRSVANNLNDIGKDHSEVLVETARRWLENATAERRWIIRHALRSAVKRGEAGALHVLGFGHTPLVAVETIRIAPSRPRIGSSVGVTWEVANQASGGQRVLLDLRVHYLKANGKHSPKVFKFKTVELAARETLRFSKSLALTQLTTRTHYPGLHRIELLVNGHAYPLGVFHITAG